jgi:hypothetical protein
MTFSNNYHFCIANQLRDVNTICRRSWYIAAHVWKIYDFKIEVVPEYGTALTTILPILFLYLNTVTVTAGTFEQRHYINIARNNDKSMRTIAKDLNVSHTTD